MFSVIKSRRFKQGTDYSEGGIGNDTYIYNPGSYTSGDGWDTLLDVDGSGSIHWNGAALGTAQQVSDDEPHLFIDTVRNISFSFAENADFATSNRGTLSITEAGKIGGIRVLDYKLGEANDIDVRKGFVNTACLQNHNSVSLLVRKAA